MLSSRGQCPPGQGSKSVHLQQQPQQQCLVPPQQTVAPSLSQPMPPSLAQPMPPSLLPQHQQQGATPTFTSLPQQQQQQQHRPQQPSLAQPMAPSLAAAAQHQPCAAARSQPSFAQPMAPSLAQPSLAQPAMTMQAAGHVAWQQPEDGFWQQEEQPQLNPGGYADVPVGYPTGAAVTADFGGNHCCGVAEEAIMSVPSAPAAVQEVPGVGAPCGASPRRRSKKQPGLGSLKEEKTEPQSPRSPGTYDPWGNKPKKDKGSRDSGSAGAM